MLFESNKESELKNVSYIYVQSQRKRHPICVGYFMIEDVIIKLRIVQETSTVTGLQVLYFMWQ